MDLSGASESVVYEHLKLQDAEAWRLAWENAVLPEFRSLRSSELARKKGISAEDLMGMLYVEMIGARKIELFRNDGGSLWGWLRKYVRGYIFHSSSSDKREISAEVSESPDEIPLHTGDSPVERREGWVLVQKCFGEMWKRNPVRAYVHLLKLRMNLSSAEIKDMLGVTSEANVDQTFSRALKEMRELKARHERQ